MPRAVGRLIALADLAARLDIDPELIEAVAFDWGFRVIMYGGRRCLKLVDAYPMIRGG